MTQATISRTHSAPRAIAVPFDDERTVAGRKFLDALTARDFSRLSGLFGSTMRTRALLPGGPHQFNGWQETLQAFRGWFNEVEDFGIRAADLDLVADRLEMRWQFRLRWPGDDVSRVIEQRAYAKVQNGQVVVLDLLCSGFRPVALAA
jgi:hypothetical protein